MRLRSILKHALVASVAIFSLQSCDNDDDYDYSILFPNALVTVKTDANDTFFLQLDDETTLAYSGAYPFTFRRSIRA